MNEEEKNLEIDSRHFVLATSEYLSTSNPQYALVRAELIEGTKMVLCLFGVDVFYISTQYAGKSEAEIKQKIRDAIAESLVDSVTKSDLVPNKTYYGTHLSDGSFEISDQKPVWEDGNWGTRME